MSRITATIGAIGLAACATHHQFAPLDPAKLTSAERVQTFMRLRPVSKTTTIENGNNPIDSSIILDDKTEVWLPEDLAPLVGDDSETMRAARASERARTKSIISWSTTIVLLAGGFVMLVASHESDNLPSYPGYLMLGGGVIGGAFVRHYNAEDISARHRAFEAYPRELGAKLNVCAHGLQVVACDGPLPAPPVPTAAPRQP
ncbi:MAG: hypothetical protein HOV81_32350 [Kofleriaceae bacterium]|nr:hypothetical protein [Kofleriaceae bacterium]